ncbi:2-keto-4-pentenoate hydratase-like protein [Caballeronia temeraria]|uniref:2-keto-4-pentenoate hydratase-like protein n=1 Tax=Caballeronia temeraria TaxID=1777137 RepID=A0A157ZTD7_9BURK|nr:2-keto-4-pentenoate hydratase [Caballeronia temeraria]SAK48177.1 2-keto-4-pentenoate hydratase-like protein [Caballeronia temeraria]
MSAGFDVDALALLFVEARGHRAKLDVLPEDTRPADADDAYAAQEATLRALNADIGGWKVGAKTHVGPIHGAPLPADGMHKTGARLSMQSFGKAGLELEVAFRLGRRFDANSGPYSDEDVIAAIESVHAAIEVVASRFAAWPDVEKPWQLADLQNHGALIVGEGVPYDTAFPFVSPAMTFTFDGAPLFEGVPANPAGDPRRLLAWTVNHSVSRGLAVERGTVLTAGSYTGIAFPAALGTAVGTIEGLPAVEMHFA